MKIKKTISIILLFILIAILCSACGKPADEVSTIKFNNNFQYIKYSDKQVKIRGYMSTLSPVNGKYIYLMNMPYQSCPFCLPNTTTIVNTIAVYSPSGKSFNFYDGPVEIIGTIKVGDTIDDFGYRYPFKIINAEYTKLDTSLLSENLKIYGALTQDGIINDIMRTANQVDFNAFFEMFEATKDDIHIITDDDFEIIIQRINAISKTDYVDIIEIINEFKEFNKDINKNIEAGEYILNSTSEMEDKIISLYNDLYEWLNKFEI